VAAEAGTPGPGATVLLDIQSEGRPKTEQEHTQTNHEHCLVCGET